jgi:chemotaxis protein MotB
MAIHRKHAEQENHERWMISYADFITLLFAFFVVMFASSQTDKSKAHQISESVQRAIDQGTSISATPAVAKVLGGTVDDKGQGNALMKGPGGAQRSTKEGAPELMELSPSLRTLTADLEKEIKDGKVVVSMQPRGLVITLQQAAFFPSGEDSIDPKTRPVIVSLAKTLNAVPNPVRLEGHTDSVPISTARFHSNWDLSAARAIALLKMLSEDYGVSRERLAIAGYAETVPMVSNDTAEGRGRNRRVDIVVLNQYYIKNGPEPVKGTLGPEYPIKRVSH